MHKIFTLISPVWYQCAPIGDRVKLWLFWSADVLLSTWILYQHPAFLILNLFIKLPALRYQAQLVAVISKDYFLSDFAKLLSQLASVIATGKSLEGAFDQTVHEFSAGSPTLAKELQRLKKLMRLGTPLAAGFERLARQYELEEATDLSRQILHAEHSGNDLKLVIKRSSDWIGSHIYHKQNLIRNMTEKVLEFRVTSKMPLIVIFLLNTVYPDYLLSLYMTNKGRLVVVAASLALEAGTVFFERGRLIQLKNKGLI